jgi:hypothetical protein
MKSRILSSLGMALLVLLGGSSGASAASYSFMGLGDLPGGNFSSEASDTSADGSVADGPQPSQGSPCVPSLTCTGHGQGCTMGL